jgi:hypothetical protein
MVTIVICEDELMELIRTGYLKAGLNMELMDINLEQWLKKKEKK